MVLILGVTWMILLVFIVLFAIYAGKYADLKADTR